MSEVALPPQIHFSLSEFLPVKERVTGMIPERYNPMENFRRAIFDTCADFEKASFIPLEDTQND